MLEATLAYKYVLIMAMISQINYYAPRLRLPIDVPIKEQDIRFLHVSPPVMIRDFVDYGGRLQVKNYSFTFGHTWHNIYYLDEHGFISFGIPAEAKESSNSIMERASRMNYSVSTNDVYRMATNWIVALDIDLKKLESAYPPRIVQGMFHSKRGLVPSPKLSVNWGEVPKGVTVEISAVSGEFTRLLDGKGDFRNRKDPLIKNLNKLIAISDEEFLKYSEQERRELVERFTCVKEEQSSSTNFVALYHSLIMSTRIADTGTRKENHKKSLGAP